VSEDKIAYLPPRGQRASAPPTPSTAGIEVVSYEGAAIHEGVPIVHLVRALNRGGFTISNVPVRGLVIHRIGQDPEKPGDPLTYPKDPA
jgi:hypothetical protein